jgi:hypothetical protein
MPNKFIDLTNPITLHGQVIKRLELREPRGGEYVSIGEPRVLVYNPSGSGYWVEQPGALAQYMEKCIVNSDLGADLIKLLSLDDAIELKEETLGFFVDAAARRAAKKSTRSPSV